MTRTRRSTDQEVQCYPDLASVQDKVELAVVATPAATVPGLVRYCAERGIGFVAVIADAARGLGNILMSFDVQDRLNGGIGT
jgi:acetyltransferase